MPPFSISQVSTLSASFADDVRAYAEAGVDAVGIWELKLTDSSLEEFQASGLGSATAVPLVPSVHPLPLLPGPDTLVVVRGLLRGGRARGLSTTIGVLCGLVLWVAAASLGLSKSWGSRLHARAIERIARELRADE